MKPIRLEGRNFGQYVDIDIDLAGLDVVAICGKNGAGKSSLLNAITWTLYGRCAMAKSDDDLIRHGQQDMAVALTFELGGARYRVDRARSRTKGSSVAFHHLTVDGPLRLTRRTIGETDAAITAALGLPYDAFLTSCMVEQGHADEFTRRTASKRKEVIYDVLGLSLWERLERAAGLRLRDSTSAVADSRARVDAADRDLATLPGIEVAKESYTASLGILRGMLADAEQRRAGAQADHLALTAQVETRNDLLRAEIAAGSAVALEEQELTRIRGRIATYDAQLRDADKVADAARRYRGLAADLDQLSRAVQPLREAHATALADAQKWERAERELESAIKVLRRDWQDARTTKVELDKSKACDTCPFVEGMRKKVAGIAEIDTEGHRLSGELKKLQEGAPALTAAVAEAFRALNVANTDRDRVFGTVQSLSALASRESEIGMAREHRTEQQKLLEVHGQALEKAMTAHSEAKSALLEVADTGPMLAAARTAMDAAERDAIAARDAIARTEERVRIADEQLARLGEVKTERERHVRALTSAEEAAARWAYLADACGKNGIPALIIENAVPAIEQSANEVLAHLPAAMHVHLILHRPLKTDAERTAETLEIEVEGAQTAMRYEGLSGGEKERVNLALRIAIARVAATRYGAQMRFLAVDEAFAGQDGEGLNATLEVLSEARQHFDLVAVVSHLTSVRDRFPAKILVWKDEEGSHARVAA